MPRASITAFAAAAVCALSLSATAAPAEAGHDGPYASGRYSQGHGYGRAPSWWSQRDRPGDYRCDAFWDANRDDCNDRWRHRGTQVRQGYSHGYAGGHGYRHRYDHGHYASQRPADVWPGAHGRPDLVYPASAPAYGAGRDPARVRWCSQQYRSYDPASGYYRAYSGRLIYCG